MEIISKEEGNPIDTLIDLSSDLIQVRDYINPDYEFRF